MALYQNSINVVQRLQEIRPKDPKEAKEIGDLLGLLGDPVFQKILTINDSLQHLKYYVDNFDLPDLSAGDFDISLDEGLIISPRIAEIVESKKSQAHQSSPDEINTSPPSETISIKLDRPENASLGLSILGLQNESNASMGVFVKDIDPNGIAGRNGYLHEGDQIIAINGVRLKHVPHKEAISLLQTSKGTLELLIERKLPPTTHKLSSPSPTTQVDEYLNSSSRSHQFGSETSVPEDVPVSYNLQTQRLSIDARARPEDVTFPLDDKMVLDSEWAEMELIELDNQGSGLGFGIVGGKSTGVVVKSILTGGVAYKDGRLKNNDHILQIGDVNLRGMSSDQVASVLRHCGSHVKLVVAREILDIPSPSRHPKSLFLPTKLLNEQLARDILPSQIIANKNILPEEPENLTESSVESLEESVTFERTLEKGNQGLGMTIAGYIGEISGIFVKSIAPGSPADLDGNIKINDQIIEVDGQSLIGVSNQDSVEVLKHTSKAVHLKFIRYLKGTKHDQLEHHTELEEPPEFTPDMKEFKDQLTITPTGAIHVTQAFEEATPDIISNIPAATTISTKTSAFTPVAQQDFEERENLLDKHETEYEKRHYNEPPQPTLSSMYIPDSFRNGFTPTSVSSTSSNFITEVSKSPPITFPKPIPASTIISTTISSISIIPSSLSLPFVNRTPSPQHRGGEDGSLIDSSITTDYSLSLGGAGSGTQQTGPTSQLSKEMLIPFFYQLPLYQIPGESFDVYLQTLLSQYDDEESREYAQKWIPLLCQSLENPGTYDLVGNVEIVYAEFDKFKKGGGLGISLEGTVDVQEDGTETRPHHYIRSILPDGPLGLNGKLKSGDELLEVNGQVLYGKNHRDVVRALKETPLRVRIICARVTEFPPPTTSNTTDIIPPPQQPFLDEEYGYKGDYSFPVEPFKTISTTTNGTHRLPPPPYPGSTTGNLRPVSYDFATLSRSSSQTPPNIIPSSGSMLVDTQAQFPEYRRDSTDRLFKAKSEGAISVADADGVERFGPVINPYSSEYTGFVLPDAYYNFNNNLSTSNNLLRPSKSLENIHGYATWSTQVLPVVLQKTSKGLGFSILDYQDSNEPSHTVIVIRSLVPGGQATIDGTIVPGDRLVYVNETSLVGLSLDAAVMALKQVPMGPVRIGIAKPIPLEEGGMQMIDQTIKQGQRIPTDVAKSSTLPASVVAAEIAKSYPQHTSEDKYMEEPSLMFKAEPAIEFKPELAIEDVKPKLPIQIKPDEVAYLKSSDEPRAPISPLPFIPPLPNALERTLKIKKGPVPLGISLQTEEVGANGCIVTVVTPDSLIKKDGRIKVGDYITSINNESLRYITPSQAKSILSRIALVSGEININYIPSDDAAIHNQSAIMAIQQQQQQQQIPPGFQPAKTLQQLKRQVSLTPETTSAPLVTPIPTPVTAIHKFDRGLTSSVEGLESTKAKPDWKQPETKFEMVEEKSIEFPSETRKSFDESHKVSPFKQLEEPVIESKIDVKGPSPTSSSIPEISITSAPVATTSTSMFEEVEPLTNGLVDDRWSPPRMVELVKNENQSYGLSIVGGTIESDLNPDFDKPVAGIFIKNVFPNGPAFRNGQLKTGDRILEINNYKVSNSSLDEAVKIIRESKNRVRFLVQSLMGSNLIPYTFTFTPKKTDVSNYSSKVLPVVTQPTHVVPSSPVKTGDFEIGSHIPSPKLSTPMAPTPTTSIYSKAHLEKTPEILGTPGEEVDTPKTSEPMIETDFTAPSPIPPPPPSDQLAEESPERFKLTTTALDQVLPIPTISLSSPETAITSPLKIIQRNIDQLKREFLDRTMEDSMTTTAVAASPSPIAADESEIPSFSLTPTKTIPEGTIFYGTSYAALQSSPLASTNLRFAPVSNTSTTYVKSQPGLANIPNHFGYPPQIPKPAVEVLLGHSKPTTTNQFPRTTLLTSSSSYETLPYYARQYHPPYSSWRGGATTKPFTANTNIEPGDVSFRGGELPYEALFPPITTYLPSSTAASKMYRLPQTTGFPILESETSLPTTDSPPSSVRSPEVEVLRQDTSQIVSTGPLESLVVTQGNELVYKISDNLERVTLLPAPGSDSDIVPSRRGSAAIPRLQTHTPRHLSMTDQGTSYPTKTLPMGEPQPSTSPDVTGTSLSSSTTPVSSASTMESASRTSLPTLSMKTTKVERVTTEDQSSPPSPFNEKEDIVLTKQKYTDLDGTKKTYIIEDETIRKQSSTEQTDKMPTASSPSSILSSPSSEKIQNKYNELPGEIMAITLPRQYQDVSAPTKTIHRLGISLAGNKDRKKLNVFIVGISSDQAKTELKIGDEILEINNHVVYGRSHLNASAIIRSITDEDYKLIISRRKDALDEMAIKPLSDTEILASLPQSCQKFDITSQQSIPPSSLDAIVDGIKAIKTSATSAVTTTGSPKKSLTPSPVKTPENKFDLHTCLIVPDTPTMITIDKKEQPLGISLTGGKDTLMSYIMIEEIHKGGAADRDGRLKVDDLILQVNGENLRKVSLTHAKECIYKPQSQVTLLVMRKTDPEGFVKTYYEFHSYDLTKKPDKSLGISIKDRSMRPRVIVTHVVKGSTAEIDGRIKPGDQILEINQKNVANYGQEDVALLLKGLSGKITFKIRRLKSAPHTNSSDATTSNTLNKTPLSEKLLKLKLSSDSLQEMMPLGKGRHEKLPVGGVSGGIVSQLREVGNVHLVQITRNKEENWGIRFSGAGSSILNQIDPQESISISDIIPGSLAEGKLKKGDRILSVNGQSIESMSLSQVNSFLNGLKGLVSFEIVKSS